MRNVRGKFKLSVPFLLALVLFCTSIVPAFADEVYFRDVSESHWAYKSINELAKRQVVNGTEPGIFSPGKSLTNAEFITMLTRLFCPGAESQEGSSSAYWWSACMETARVGGFLTGTTVGNAWNARVGEWDVSIVEATVNRYDMAQMIYNYLKLVNKVPSSALRKDAEKSIPDIMASPTNYRETVVAVYAAGIIKGVDDVNTFAGDKTLTRAEGAEVLWRMYEPLLK